MGRPTKLTPETAKKIVNAIRAGNYIETAAAYAGVQKQTLYNWMRRGRMESASIYRAFLDAIEKALAAAELEDVRNIRGAARDGQWQASAWRLERKFPDRWGRRDQVAVTADIKAEVRQVPDVAKLEDDELAELRRILARATGGAPNGNGTGVPEETVSP